VGQAVRTAAGCEFVRAARHWLMAGTGAAVTSAVQLPVLRPPAHLLQVLSEALLRRKLLDVLQARRG